MNTAPAIWTTDKVREQQLQPIACHDASKVLLMADRFERADSAQREWAGRAKQCVDFFEGKQWSEEDVRKLTDEGRPALTFNKIAPLIRLVQGYYTNNRTDLKFNPSHDNTASASTAEALNKISKQISNGNDKQYIDTEVFLDGMLTGRGYYDMRLSFAKNILGEVKYRSADPFAIRIDPDCNTYDLNESGSFVFDGRWVSLDDIIFTYGQNAGNLLYSYFGSGGYRGGIPAGLIEMSEEITPWRSFGGYSSDGFQSQRFMDNFLATVYDPARKCIRLIDMQHKVPMMMRYIVDLETGQKEPVPDSFTPERTAKMMQWLEEKSWMAGKACPWRLTRLMGHKVRWTTMVGDLIVYDDWSQYETFTLVPFFPYFRRGKTRGLVDDLIDPQREVNKRRSSEIDIVTRTAHSGWMYHRDSLDEDGKENIERNGATPGVNIEWGGKDTSFKPERINPGVSPVAMSNLEVKATAELKEIAGINDSALGQLDRVQSGRAIEARQRQSVLAIQSFMDNNSRTQKMCGRKELEIVQNHYTQRRVYSTIDDNGQPGTTTINDMIASGEIVNDVAVGNYDVSVDESPLSASFLAAQFDEMIDMVEKGILPIEAVQDVAVDISSLPRKDLIKQRVQAIMAAKGIPMGDAVMQPGAAQQIAAQGAQPGQPPVNPAAGANPAQQFQGSNMASANQITGGEPA